MRVRYRELALSDLDHIFRYLDQRSPAGARKVIHAIRAAIDDVAQIRSMLVERRTQASRPAPVAGRETPVRTHPRS